MSLRQDIDPSYAKEQAIGVALANPLLPLHALSPVRLLLTPQGSALGVSTPQDPDTFAPGLVVPIVVEVTGPSTATSGGRRVINVFRRTVPKQVVFTPREGGLHLVVVSELYHNRFYGSIVLDVAGDPLG